jgi:hypothetical protein
MAQSITPIDTRDQSNRTNRAPISPRWIRPVEFSAATGMSRRGVYNALADGTLKGVQVSGSWFIRIEELDAYFERNGQPAA